MKNILKNNGKIILLGNEAIVRGALESGVQFVSTYPGTPASEIGDTFSKLQIPNLYFEYSANEKVALEAGIGASFSNLKVLVAMKNFGLNVALESLLPFCYTGSKGPTVIVVSDDPSCHSSAESEENSRGFAQLAHIPILEPSDPQECQNFVKIGFQISKKYKIPVMLRLTTRVSHQRAPIKLKKLPRIKKQGRFIKDKNQFVTMPPRVLEMKKELFDKIKRIRKEVSEVSKINKLIIGNGNLGIITSGVSYLYVREALEELNLNIPILKLGFFYPCPKEQIKKFMKGLKKVLVIEELEPYLENTINQLAKNINPKIQVFGKSHLSEVGELKPEDVISAIAKIVEKEIKTIKNYGIKPIKHLPRFCPACPYWKVFSGVKKATLNYKNIIFGGDIGCYMMAAFCFNNFYDYLSCMSSSIGIAHGIAKATEPTDQKIIAFIGDSTFFHSGIPALINCVYNKSNLLVIILDNQITAMTGHQPNPGVKSTGQNDKSPKIKIENIIQALEIKNWKIIDPIKNYDIFIKTVKRFLNKKRVSVIIARHPCWLYYEKKY